MSCPACGRAKPRRACPALGQRICAVCCGTKRLVEIRCPSDCAYLASAREHPAAVVRRQQQRDVAALLPTIGHLTERQYQLFFLFHTLVARHKPEGFARLGDADVAEAAAALAGTLETAARGVIYEQTPASPIAQALVRELKTTIAGMREQRAAVYDHEIAVTLRAIEDGARRIGDTAAGGTAYLELLGRLLQAGPAEQPPSPEPPGGSLIVS